MAKTVNKGPGEITQGLALIRKGDKAAEEKLLEEVYRELRRLAAAYLRRERPDHSLQPTALVHEAHIKFADLKRLELQDRAHFFGVAARLMRQVLVDHARARKAIKRGGDILIIPITKSFAISRDGDTPTEILALHDGLDALEKQNSRAASVVELRYFAGLSIDETAQALDIGSRTVRRDWNLGRAWLRRELGRGAAP